MVLLIIETALKSQFSPKIASNVGDMSVLTKRKLLLVHVFNQ